MISTDHLRGLQWDQLLHDEGYHKDIASMPPATRMKHFALHMAKYAAYLLDAEDTDDGALLERTLVDSFAIILAIGNTLGQNLAADVVADPAPVGSNSASLWRTFVRQTGALAKACESLDHIEDIPFKPLMKKANAALASAVLLGADRAEIDLAAAYRARMREVEARSPFDDLIQARQAILRGDVLGQ